MASELVDLLEGCPEAERLQRLARGHGEEEDLREVREHVVGCAACSAALAFLEAEPGEEESPTTAPAFAPASLHDRSDRLVEAATGLDVVGAPVTPGGEEGTGRSPGAAWIFRLAASLVLAGSLGIMGWLWSQGGLFQDDIGRFRTARSLELVAPRGEMVLAPRVFRWTGHPQAASYRVILFDEGMSQVWDGVTGTAETELEVPHGGLPSAPPGAWRTWQVVALGELGEEIARSPAAHFKVAGVPPSD